MSAGSSERDQLEERNDLACTLVRQFGVYRMKPRIRVWGHRLGFGRRVTGLCSFNDNKQVECFVQIFLSEVALGYALLGFYLRPCLHAGAPIWFPSNESSH